MDSGECCLGSSDWKDLGIGLLSPGSLFGAVTKKAVRALCVRREAAQLRRGGQIGDLR